VEGTGRVNQKRRTRTAIVEAAQRLLEQGTMPTVAEAAAEAEVGRTTAYRYFPTQDSLLVELAITADVSDVEELIARPVDPADASERLVEVLQLLNEHVLAEEARYRTAMRVYQDQWLAGHAEGEDAPMVRSGRRQRWFRTIIEPLAKERGLPPKEVDRLVRALGLCCGTEAIATMRDVYRLKPAEALAVTEWAARALLAVALDDRGS
jgi:AcrR family transcriptional regulator